ncbi:Small GTPase LIP1 [Bienertia sinuspersici]
MAYICNEPIAVVPVGAAKEARIDKEAVTKFFRTLIRRRYFSEELAPPNPWSVSPIPRSFPSSGEITSSKDHFTNHRRYSLIISRHTLVHPLSFALRT